jgi:hypothetical protein
VFLLLASEVLGESEVSAKICLRLSFLGVMADSRSNLEHLDRD